MRIFRVASLFTPRGWLGYPRRWPGLSGACWIASAMRWLAPHLSSATRRGAISPPTHGGGEEFFVLEGTFQDEHGEFPAGSYVRNPPTSRHTPGSVPGCVLFVKLWQFDLSDRTEVMINTRSMPYRLATGRPGVELIPLFCDSREEVRLERWAPGTAVTVAVPGGVEVLVLDGDFYESGERFEAQSGCGSRPAAHCCRPKPVRRAARSGSRPATCGTTGA